MAEQESIRNVSYTAGWAENVSHRPDPNRVGTLQTVTPGQPLAPRTPAARPLPTDTGTRHEGRPVGGTTGAARQHDPQARPQPEPSYYDVPMLKQPLWKWEIATYFFLGGVSTGAYLLGRAAERAGGPRHRDLSRVAAYLAMAALLPSPPLLIHDLGDPKRFHHMLRVWKPSSPMNLGTWAIVAYSGMAAFEVVRQYLNEHEKHLCHADRCTLAKIINNPVLLLVHDAAGVPFSLMVAGYTGVLLSCTSNPLWAKNPYLGPLFSASAIATGAEAITLALDCIGDDDDHADSQRTLQRVDTLAHAVELAMMQGFQRVAGEKAKTLHTGQMAKHHKFSKAAIIGAEVLKALPVPRRAQRPVRMLAAALGLAGGLAMRWAMVFGGHEAAADPHTSRLASAGDPNRAGTDGQGRALAK